MTLNQFTNYLVALSIFFTFLFIFLIKQMITASLSYAMLCFVFICACCCVGVLLVSIITISDILIKLRLIYFANFTDRKIKNFFVRKRSVKNNLSKNVRNLILKNCFIKESETTYDVILVEDIRLFNLIKLYRSHIFSYETVLIIYHPDHSELALEFGPLPDDYFNVNDMATYSRFKIIS